MTPWLWEMFLLLPNPLFQIASVLFLSPIDLGKGSHYRWDLENGRKTTIKSHLGEIIEAGAKYSQDTSILSTVLHKIVSYEDSLQPNSSLDLTKSKADTADIAKDFEYFLAKPGKKGGDQEFLYYASRVAIGLLFIPVLIFLFYF